MKVTLNLDLKRVSGLVVLIGLLVFLAFTSTFRSATAPNPVAPQNSQIFGSRWVPGTLEIHHIYVGQGDAVLVIAPSGKTLLYDIGERDWPLHDNADLVTQYITQVTGKKELDYIVLSHFHQDHVGNSKLTESGSQYDGGIFYLLKKKAIKVHKVIDRGFDPILPRTPIATKYKQFSESEEGKKLLPRETAKLGPGQIDLGKELNIMVVAANGKAWKDGKEVTILSEAEIKADPPPSENDLSLCLKISWNDFEYFIGGDLSGQDNVSPFGYKYHDIESGVADAIGNVEVYRVSHHGSDHSSNEKFVNTLDPEVSIDSSGTGNRFGHPRQTVIDRLLNTSDLFITSREGGASGAKYKRAVEGGNVVVRVYNGGYNYDVSVVRSYRSYTDTEEAKHLDDLLDYEQQQVQYEEAAGISKPDEDEDGTSSGDVTAGGNGPDPDDPNKDSKRTNTPTRTDDATSKNGFPRVRAKEHDKLQNYVGKKLFVWGKVTSTFTPASNKVKFINIDTEDLDQSFTLVIFQKDWANFFDNPKIGDPSKYYQGKFIEVSGVVIAYDQDGKGRGKKPEGEEKRPSNKLEMIINGPHQIELLPFRKEGR